ncbi:hypothetical protein SAY86_002978 [Trapa natans]|uniref:Lycopene epsilon-cyclase n=1 Tax=Trapa natans TaxID=22666 RepID=A0AAN7R019_TRANT|nr:hypothetical protein SAY86_002978 [Trapa natans]
MECVFGVRNFSAAMAGAPPSPVVAGFRGGRRSIRTWKKASLRRCIVEASVAKSESQVALKEGVFADEEDYRKAGGSELYFVQMQQKKTMENQSRFSDKLLPISPESGNLDLVVIGCGPAGLALAAESAKLGLKVGLIGPDLPFTNNYGVWDDEFRDLGLEKCIEHVWQDTIVYLDDSEPITIGRAYGRVSRHLLHEELLERCVKAGVLYLNSKVESIVEAADGHSLIACDHSTIVPCRLATVASGAASGRLLQYEVGGPRVSVQTAYGIEVEVESSPYDPKLMVFMDYRDYMKQKVPSPEAKYPTFLYAMPMSPTRVFFEVLLVYLTILHENIISKVHILLAPVKLIGNILQETCLASKDAMPFDLLKKKLLLRLQTMKIRITKVYEEEWSYIPVGGSLPNTEQKNLAFGAAASMVHPATGYSVVRSLSEAPKYAAAIANVVRQGHNKAILVDNKAHQSISMQAWKTLWPQERKRRRAFFLFGLALIVQLDIEGTRTFFNTFFRLPRWMWWGFLGSSLSSGDLMVFAFYMFLIAPNDLRKALIRHLLSDPTGSTMIRTYLTI